jgi:hypothetical protein
VLIVCFCRVRLFDTDKSEMEEHKLDDILSDIEGESYLVNHDELPYFHE